MEASGRRRAAWTGALERAAGSNGELRAGLRIAARWGYIANAAALRCDGVADEVAAMLWRLMHR